MTCLLVQIDSLATFPWMFYTLFLWSILNMYNIKTVVMNVLH